MKSKRMSTDNKTKQLSFVHGTEPKSGNSTDSEISVIEEVFSELDTTRDHEHHQKTYAAWFLHSVQERIRIKKSITPQEKKQLYHGMLLTRATDNALKQLFLSGEITFEGKSFQGKGFRSLGQEAIFAAAMRLNCGAAYQQDGRYVGDIAAPLIRDLGVFLAMTNGDVETAINAQAGKSGPPCDGRDLHVGDFTRGVLIPAAPLAIATCTLIGLALSFKLKKEPRVALSFIGEGGSSLGEWHEAINFASVLSLPMVFCIENNQTALSTPTSQQSRARCFADKALGYGINALSINGNDAEEVFAAFAFAVDEARKGNGPILIELLTMRMCGHAHHDDMLYLGHDPALSFHIPSLKGNGYVQADLFEQWQRQDPIALYEQKLLVDGVLSEHDTKAHKEDAEKRVKDAIARVSARPWPRLLEHDEAMNFKAPWIFLPSATVHHPRSNSEGITYLQAIAEGVRTIFTKHRHSYVIGEDVAPPYGNAFMMFKALGQEFPDRFINTPISENAIVGACVGMSMNGMLPIGEMQFNDFVACAVDQVANNAAKHFFRTAISLPMVLRMPYGGLRSAGPYHSQDTSPWFYQTPGLKIMAPSTPLDTMLMLIKAAFDPDPVLFYEHIALYREPKIKQLLSDVPTINCEGAALRNEGTHVTLISYGAYAHRAYECAKHLEEIHGITADVIDLRYLMPLDLETIYRSVKKTSRVLLFGEDKRTGGILESIASRIGQDLFSYLDAPVSVLGSRFTPVPYAPSLERDYLLSDARIVEEAKALVAY